MVINQTMFGRAIRLDGIKSHYDIEKKCYTEDYYFTYRPDPNEKKKDHFEKLNRTIIEKDPNSSWSTRKSYHYKWVG